MRKLLTALVALATLASLAPAATATTVLKVDVPEMTRLSDWVVKARVVDLKTVDLRREGKTIYTDVVLAIDETYRGVDVPKTYALRLIGGVGADDLAVTVPGMPRFERGEEVVLFLEQTPGGHVLCGLGQGVFRVHRLDNGATWVEQSTGHVNLMARAPNGRLLEAQPQVMAPVKSLRDLVAEINAAQVPAR